MPRKNIEIYSKRRHQHNRSQAINCLHAAFAQFNCFEDGKIHTHRKKQERAKTLDAQMTTASPPNEECREMNRRERKSAPLLLLFNWNMRRLACMRVGHAHDCTNRKIFSRQIIIITIIIIMALAVLYGIEYYIHLQHTNNNNEMIAVICSRTPHTRCHIRCFGSLALARIQPKRSLFAAAVFCH